MPVSLPAAFPAVQPGRKITGMSAVLLPFTQAHEIDWPAFDAHVERTLTAGLIPAVNMDTGYINLLDDATRVQVLQRTQTICSSRQFVAGAFVADIEGAAFDFDQYAKRITEICDYSGTPVLFQSFGLTGQSDDGIVSSYQQLATTCDRFVGFELGTMFLPFGKIYSEEVYVQLMKIKECVGAKHSSLRRDLEWKRLELRDAIRPDFMVLTGNDLAIDMVTYGSDYLLGLSSFCPELFAKRDAMWERSDPEFYQLNDVLQYLGFFAFRDPVPAYKHTCAMFLKLQNFIATNKTHPSAIERPESDIEILDRILQQLKPYVDQ